MGEIKTNIISVVERKRIFDIIIDEDGKIRTQRVEFACIFKKEGEKDWINKPARWISLSEFPSLSTEQRVINKIFNKIKGESPFTLD